MIICDPSPSLQKFLLKKSKKKKIKMKRQVTTYGWSCSLVQPTSELGIGMVVGWLTTGFWEEYGIAPTAAGALSWIF